MNRIYLVLSTLVSKPITVSVHFFLIREVIRISIIKLSGNHFCYSVIRIIRRSIKPAGFLYFYCVVDTKIMNWIKSFIIIILNERLFYWINFVHRYNTFWYNTNTRTKLLLVLVLRSCSSAPNLSAGGLLVFNLKNFSEASISSLIHNYWVGN